MIPAALIAIALGASSPCGLPALADGQRPWRAGETLTYDLDVLGLVKVGTLEITVDRPISGGKVIPLRARARTTPPIAMLKPFAGVALSWIRAGTLLPERYRDEADEGGVRRMSDTRILPRRPELVMEYRYGEDGGKATYEREGEVLDALSTLTYLRAARLAPGDHLCFDVVGNRRFWRFEGRVAGEETVETPAGRFEALRVDAALRRADAPTSRARPLSMWIGTDERRLPVAIRSELDVGPASALLSGIRGAR